MTATDELRRLLDERGVEYTIDHGYREFFWDFGESGRARASAIGTKGLVQVIVTGITPEQTIDATLGRGTCHRALDFDGTRYVCSACGEHFGPCRWHYCPNCGRRVMDV